MDVQTDPAAQAAYERRLLARLPAEKPASRALPKPAVYRDFAPHGDPRLP